MPGMCFGQSAIGKRKQYPIRFEVDARGFGDGANQLFRSVHGLDQCPGDRIKCLHDAFQTLCGDAELGIEIALARPYAGKPIEIFGEHATPVRGYRAHIATRNNACN